MAKHTSTNDLAGATPVPVPDSVPVAAWSKGPARARKAPAAGPDYAALGVPDALVDEMERLRRAFVDLGRRSTGQVFDCGAVIHEVRELAPDQKAFAKWSKVIFRLSRRGAENYAAVHRTLLPYRQRMEKFGLVASALYHLASASAEQVEEVLTVRESGRELTIGQIKAMVAPEGKAAGKAAAGAKPDGGGPAGLKALMAQKATAVVPALMDNAFEILKSIYVALEPHRNGKRVPKEATALPLIHPVRLLRGQLEALTWTAAVAGQDGKVQLQPMARGDKWEALRQMLFDLGGADYWPDADKVGPWLAGTVVPLLEWLLGPRAEKAAVVIKEMAKAAEAERAKAAKEKERARFEAKKARMKAKREAFTAQNLGMGGRNAAGVPSGTVETGPAKAPVGNAGDLATTGLTAASGQA